MTDNTPLACSLNSGDLQHRLAEIAELGAASLKSHDHDDGRHRLRFQADAGTRARLEAIIEAERACCSFLDLSLVEVPGELVLMIEGPGDAWEISDELARAFAGSPAHE